MDEIATVDKNEEKIILDLGHDALTTDENSIYKYEDNDKRTEEPGVASQLKSLGLAMMLSKNPTFTDDES